MLLRQLIYILVLFASINSGLAIASTPVRTLQAELNISNGLSHNGASCIFKDSRGYIWIGTYDGLNRYNGTSILTYKNRVDEHLFQSNRIRSIAEDDRGRLWIGTDMGVTIFDYDKETFTPLLLENDTLSATIVSILFNEQEQIMSCFTLDGNVYNVSLDGSLISHYDNMAKISVIRAVAMDDDRVFIATNKGLRIYSIKNNTVEGVDGLHRAFINDIVATPKSGEYIIAYGRGIQRIGIDEDEEGYKVRRIDSPKFAKMPIKRIGIDKEQNVWLGRDKYGVMITPYEELLRPNVQPDLDMPKRRISDFLFDDDIIYISTFDRGLFKFDTYQSPFKVVGDSGEYKQAEIVPLKKDQILVRSGAKLTVTDLKSNKIIEPPFKLNIEIEDAAKSIFSDKDGSIWIAYRSNDGSTRVVKIDDNQRVIPIDDHKLQMATLGTGFNNYPVESIFDRWGNIWIGYPNNLYRIVLDEDQSRVIDVEWITANPYFEDRLSISKIRSLYSDPKDGSVWAGTISDGVYRIVLDEQTSLSEADIENYTYEAGVKGGLTSNFVSSILRSNVGVLYIGTEQGGVCIADESGDTIRFNILSEREGLSNNAVKSLTEDADGNIWIGTNIGLNMLKKGDTKSVKVFKQDDGLINEDFWYDSHLCEDGRVVMSNVDGLSHFYPTNISTESDKPRLYFDNLTINNKEVQAGVEFDGRVIMNSRLRDNDEVILKHDENHITIKVDAIFNKRSSNSSIRYYLSPGSSEWINSKDGQITLINIQPGLYKLSVATHDSSKNMNEAFTLNIRIKPPFWKSALAYLIYVLIIISFFVIILRVMMKFQSLNHKLEIEGIEKGNSENKLRYLSNVSHELKTPLSLILAPLAILQEKFTHDGEVRAKLQTIKRQSKKMLEIIDLTHGVEVNDLKMMRLTPITVNFRRVINYLSPDFEFMAEYDNKVYEIERSEEYDVDIVADLGMLEKIISNLLSNAFKHTVAGDKVTLRYWSEGGNLTIQVEDNGCGIDPEDLPRIFERFYQAKRTSGANLGGTGIGLTLTKRLVELHEGEIRVESEVDHGTTFTVTLPNATRVAVDNTPQEHEDKVSEFITEIDSEIIIQSDFASSLIYLVEDNAELRKLLEEVIGRYYNVRSFDEPLKMLEALENEWPDLIVSDVMMPNMDGYELCHRIKDNIQTSHIPVILLTACNTVEQKIKGLNSGADAYIPKPFYPKHIITRIETLLNNRQILRERYQTSIPLVMGRKGDTTSKDSEFMMHLYEYFNEHLDNEDINIDETAKVMGQNRSMFFKKVKSITNRSPYELLKEYRLQRGAELLQSGNYNVNEVCIMVGFKDRSHFSRLFKEKYGCSPSKYAKS